MSDTTEDVETAGLHERMRCHLVTYEPPEDLESFRRTVASGDPLSEIVDEEREEGFERAQLYPRHR